MVRCIPRALGALVLLLAVTAANGAIRPSRHISPALTPVTSLRRSGSSSSNRDGSDDGSVGDASPPSNEPFVGWLVQVGDACAGVLIAPTAVLTSETCATHALDAELPTVQVWSAETDETDKPYQRRDSAQRIPIVRNKDSAMHDMFARGHAAYDFAVIELSKPAATTPVPLFSFWDDRSVERYALHVYGVQRSRGGKSTQVTHTASDAADSTLASQRDAWRELVSVRVRETCAVLHPVSADAGTSPSPTFLVARSQDSQRVGLVGMSPAVTLACQDASERGMSRNAFFRVSSLRKLIDTSSTGHSWVSLSAKGDTTGAISSSSSSSSSSNSNSNNRGSSNSSRGNASTGDNEPSGSPNNAAAGNDTSDVSAPSSAPPFRLSSISWVGMISVEDAVSARFGPLIALIAPTFAVTRAQWIVESGMFEDGGNSAAVNETMLAVFGDVVTPVKQLIFQRESDRVGAAHLDADAEDGDLVVVELESPVTQTPSRIAFPMLPLDVASPRFVLEAVDSLTGPENASNMMYTLRGLSVSGCQGTTQGWANGIICANVLRVNGFSPQHHLVALNQGVLLDDGNLIGLSARNASDSSSSLYDTFAFFQLSASRHFRFLTNATQSGVKWASWNTASDPPKIASGSSTKDGSGTSDGDVGDTHTDTRREFPSYIVGFEGDGSVEPSCQGILVAPKFVLTTASCAHGRNITAIVFALRDSDNFRAPYDPQTTIVHPRYNKSAPPDERFDFAILPLAFATDIAPARLSLGGANQADELLAFKGVEQGRASLGAEENDKHPIAIWSFAPQAPVKLHQLANCSTRGYGNSSSARAQTTMCLRKLPPSPSPSPSATVVLPAIGKRQFVSQQIVDEYPGITRDPTSSLNRSVIGRELNNTSTFNNSRTGVTGRSSSYSVLGFAFASEDDGGEDGMYSVIPLADAAVFVNAFVAGASWEAGGVIVDGPLQTAKRFIVGLRASKSSQNFCGGSLIAPTSVLTAAHCVTDGLANWVSVGSKTSSGVGTEEIQVVKRSVVVHASYGKPSKFSFDAAIFELASPAYADPVVLDHSPDFADGEKATMFGYGAARSGISVMSTEAKTLSSEIRAVDLSLMSLEKCAKTLPDIDNSMLCAVGKDGADACQGDSGGPLVLPSQQSSKDVLVGFVSSGYDCGLKNVPGIYMRVSSLAQFIQDNTAGAKWSTSVASQPPPVVTPTPTLSDSELRNLDSLRPRENVPSGSGNNGALSTATTTPGLGSQTTKSPIRSMDAPQSLNPQVHGALLLFLLGVSDARVLSADLLERLATESNVIRFFSTGDLSTLLAIIRRHNDSPLYARSDRFGRRKQRLAALPLASVVARISNVCSA